MQMPRRELASVHYGQDGVHSAKPRFCKFKTDVEMLRMDRKKAERQSKMKIEWKGPRSEWENVPQSTWIEVGVRKGARKVKGSSAEKLEASELRTKPAPDNYVKSKFSDRYYTGKYMLLYAQGLILSVMMSFQALFASITAKAATNRGSEAETCLGQQPDLLTKRGEQGY